MSKRIQEAQEEKLPNRYLQRILKDTLQITQFRGVFACDRVPKLKQEQSVILNTDPHYKRGKHFVALFYSNGRYIYFDPLAENIEIQFPEFYRVLKRKKMLNALFKVLDSPIQDAKSNFCGLFCLDYILGLYKPFSKAKVQTYVTDLLALRKNDSICVKNVVKKLKMK